MSVWLLLMMCSAAITMSRLTADAKQDLACDRGARRRVATVVLRNCELARCWMCAVSRSRHRLESWHQSHHRSPSRYCTTTEQSMILKLGIRPADERCFAWLGAPGIKTATCSYTVIDVFASASLMFLSLTSVVWLPHSMSGLACGRRQHLLLCFVSCGVSSG